MTKPITQGYYFVAIQDGLAKVDYRLDLNTKKDKGNRQSGNYYKSTYDCQVACGLINGIFKRTGDKI
ncbi:MAG: hypothetical protein RR382_12920 [Tannerellaceae bacterium]